MARKQKKYHFIYKTTNKINGKFYVGMHSTDNLNDGYIGSGKRLRYSINKYGKENHAFEILEFLPSRKLLKEREEKIVDEKFLKNPLCMNIVIGGEGGWFGHPNSLIPLKDPKIKKIAGKNGSASRVLKCSTEEKYKIKYYKKLSDGLKKYYKTHVSPFKGKSHTQEHKEKMSMIMKKKQCGEKNSQYGTIWITNGKENKKIKKTDKIPKKWNPGRTTK